MLDILFTHICINARAQRTQITFATWLLGGTFNKGDRLYRGESLFGQLIVLF
jgi:hypothetical protein